MSEAPMPYGFGTPPSKPIQNKQLYIDRKKYAVQNAPKMPTKTMMRFGIHLMEDGDVNTFSFCNTQEVLRYYSAVYSMLAKYGGDITVARNETTITITCHKSIKDTWNTYR